MLKAARATWLHERALAIEEGAPAEAERLYKQALELDPNRPETLYNLGLLCKEQGRWSESLSFNRRALELAPTDEASCWNLGIAATALGDWPTAREAWHRYGLAIPAGSGSITMDLGSVPIRLPHGEVVWTQRIDPARAILQNIPLPESGFAWGDLVLHDGAPNGYRQLNGQEVPVFDALAWLERSTWSTFALRVSATDQGAMAELESLCEQAGLNVEDWTGSVRLLCKECSEGRPHTCTVQNQSGEWKRERRVGIAAESVTKVDEVLSRWAKGPDRTLLVLELAVER